MADTEILCPKCQFRHQTPVPICQRCGLIFARFKSRQVNEQIAEPELVEPNETLSGRSLASWKKLLLTSPPGTGLPVRIGRSLLLLAMLVWGMRLALAGIESNAAGESLLHLVNLPFHEAGHVVFRPFGQFITSLGGTLGQLLVPIICLLALLLKNRDTFGAAVCLWWLGENFLDIAPYIYDARAGQLPLLGGNFGHSAPYGFHDWEYLLTESGLLSWDHALARLSHGLGSLLILLALLWASYLLVRSRTGERT